MGISKSTVDRMLHEEATVPNGQMGQAGQMGQQEEVSQLSQVSHYPSGTGRENAEPLKDKS